MQHFLCAIAYRLIEIFFLIKKTTALSFVFSLCHSFNENYIKHEAAKAPVVISKRKKNQVKQNRIEEEEEEEEERRKK